MKKKTKIIFLLVLLLTNISVGQVNTKLIYKSLSWEENPKIHTLTDKEKEGNYIILKDKVLIEFAYESSGNLIQYATRHLIVHYNSKKGVEAMNKVYIPSGDILEEMELKARTITADGKIIILDKNSIKRADNLEDKGPFIYFAMEGVDVGCEIEYLYTNKKTAQTNSAWKVQTDAIHKNFSIDIYSPDNLVFEAVGYNGFPPFTSDTSITEKNHLFSSVALIEALNEEKYSMYDANKMRFEFQLAYNKVNGKARMYTWESCGRNLYERMFTFEKAEQKAIEKLISKLKLKDLKSDEEKIRALEMFAKTTISISDNENTVDKVLDLKHGTAFNLQCLYIGVLSTLNVPLEAVITSDRTTSKFDGAFPSWNNLDEVLIYFPSLDQFLSPSSYSSRLGFPPPELTNNQGLFIKETGIGDIKTGISKIKTITAPSYKLSHNNIHAVINFNPETFTPIVNFKQDFVGYSAYYLQPSLYYVDQNQKKEILDDLSKFIGKETVVKSTKFSGIEKEDILVKPLLIESEVETPSLVENAGNKYLFHVGLIMGPQEEMYQEKARQMIAEIMYAHSFTRTINVKIPTGYKIKNMDDINISKKYSEGNEDLASFISSYTIEGDILKINVYEDYKTIAYSREKFDDFKGVINASADFNKVVLIFEKI